MFTTGIGFYVCNVLSEPLRMDDNDGVVVNTSEFPTSRLRSLPGRGEYDLIFNVDIVNLLLKKQWGERQKA